MGIAQLVRALDCGSRGRRFETGLPPKNQKETDIIRFPFFIMKTKLPILPVLICLPEI